MTVYTPNRIAAPGVTAPEPALKPDGTNYKYRMFFNGNRRIVDTDSLQDAIHSIIRGYRSMTPLEQREARIQYARGISFSITINRMANPPSEELQQWEQDVLNSEAKPVYGWGDGTGQLNGLHDDSVPDIWKADTVLVIVEADYSPYTLTKTPVSHPEGKQNILMLRTEDEEEFLNSLTATGDITFGRPVSINS